MRKANQLTILALFSFLLLISFNNCSGGNSSPSAQTTASLGGGGSVACDQVADSLRTPNSIGDVINLVNALPKPLTIDCFLISLKKPLKVMAVNNTFSAQPAVKNESPRIFIVNSRLSISVVPAGIGRYLVEMSEPTSATSSFKAEIEFPVQQTMDPYLPFSRIVDKMTGNSQCVMCHRNEEKKLYPGVGYGFNSDIVRPNEYQRIFSLYLRNQAYMCDPKTDKFRCDMLNAIFTTGEAQDADFPF